MKTGAMSLSELLTSAEPYLVGVWRYHERGGPQQWYCSVHFEGEFFDLPASDTMREALQRVVDELPSGPPSGLEESMELRPCLQWFSGQMEKALRKHDGDRGERSWQKDDPLDLFRRLEEETDELREALHAPPMKRSDRIRVVTKEAADVANFAMMIADWYSEEPPVCAICGKPATCVGCYEETMDGPNIERPACDDCCGHGNEDGHCKPIQEEPPVGEQHCPHGQVDVRHTELPDDPRCPLCPCCGVVVVGDEDEEEPSPPCEKCRSETAQESAERYANEAVILGLPAFLPDQQRVRNWLYNERRIAHFEGQSTGQREGDRSV